MFEDDAEALARRIRVALGRERGDLLVTGGQVVNVFNRRVEPADLVIADGRRCRRGLLFLASEGNDRRNGIGAHPGPDRRSHASRKHVAEPL